MQVIYATRAQEDYDFWKVNQPKMIKRIDQLITDIKKHPFTGLGKPEPLRFKKSGYWSRRITQEHRLVYKVVDKKIYIIQCRFHY